MALVLICSGVGLCVGLTLIGEHRGSRALKWASKPLASAGFVVAALHLGAGGSTYGRVLLAGLGLCLLGDLLLIPRESRRAFLGGLVSFLLGHASYAAAFIVRGVGWIWIGVAALPVACAAALTLRWLWPHVDRRMRPPVSCYVLVISVMVCCAAGTVALLGRWTILAGALAFFLSDLSVARDRFVKRSILNRLWGLPLYYAAQLVLATTVACPVS